MTITLRAAARRMMLSGMRLDVYNAEQDQNKNDQQDRTYTAAAIVSKAWAHACSAEAEDKDQNNKKDNHAFSVQFNFTALSEMQILIVA